MSASQFHRLFKSETGKTPFHFCQEIKLQFAFESLTSKGDASIMDKSIQLGYKDYETFSRAFKKQFHLTPGDLKAIAERIKLETQPEAHTQKPDGMMIATFEGNNLTDDIILKLMKIDKANNYSVDDFQNAHIYTISKKEDLSLSENLIKNKFELTKDQKIWQQLITGA